MLNETAVMWLSLTLCGAGGMGLLLFGTDSEEGLRVVSIMMGLGAGPIYSCILLHMERFIGHIRRS